MKIKNDYVNIKIGEKTYELRNMILNDYIQEFIKRSLNTSEVSKLIRFKSILLKLDTPFENITYNSQIDSTFFDIKIEILPDEYEQELNGTNLTITYSKIVGQYDEVKLAYDDQSKELNYFNGRKICNIGFGYIPTEYEELYSFEETTGAIIDTSNYNIYIQANETLSITRKDIISTDAVFATNNKSKIPAPAHLAPGLLDKILDVNNANSFKCSGILYSVSNSIDGKTIEKEYIVGTDVTTRIVNNSIVISTIENRNEKNLYYLGDNGNVYLGYSYLVKPFSRYIILKYKVMQLIDNTVTDTGYYYTLRFRTKFSGNLKVKINYERGE